MTIDIFMIIHHHRSDRILFHCEPLELFFFYFLRVKSFDYHVIGQVPELEELLSIPAEALQKELCLSREEVPEAKSFWNLILSRS